jgi:two-component sensor histidine kinase
VSVIDNGKGVAEDFTPETAANLGLQIVKTLTENELNGTIEFIRREQGTQAEINFPLNN